MNELIQPSSAPWRRPRNDIELLGVCTALSSILAIPASMLRLGFLSGGILFIFTFSIALPNTFSAQVATTALGITSSSVLLYLILWWALPRNPAPRDQVSTLDSRLTGKPSQFVAGLAVDKLFNQLTSTVLKWIAISSILGLTATSLLISGFWIFLNEARLFPELNYDLRFNQISLGVGLIIGGITLGRLPLEVIDEARFSGKLDSIPKHISLTLLLAISGILSGALIIIHALFGLLAVLLTSATAILVMTIFLGVLTPWVKKLWNSVKAESTQRALIHQQAEIASHLHDSVLQTLTLIGRNATSDFERKQLARRQERELRNWLYGSAKSEDRADKLMSEAIKEIAVEIENLHEVSIEVVSFGNQKITPKLDPLLGAYREAVNNAARHARLGIQVFCDLEADPLEIYVRDRGKGFDMENIDPSRLGIKESIIGRMDRAGGKAKIYPAIGGGTEVLLSMPG